MRAALKLPISIQDYLEGEKRSEIKHEYVDGRVHAMTGTSRRHHDIAFNLTLALRTRAKGGPCKPYMEALKVQIPKLRRYYYPDVVLSCRPDDPNEYLVADPCLIGEVLSPSTEGIDRREKLDAYQTLPTLKEYLLIGSVTESIEVWRRTPAGWVQEELDAGDAVRIDCLDASIPITEIYAP